jgi:hypothetical protein
MKTRFFAVVLLTLFTCSLAYAGSTSCGTATAVVPDGRILDFDNVQASTTNWYQFTGKPGRSYSIEVRDDLDTDPGTDLTSTLSGTTGTGVYSGSCAASKLTTTTTPPVNDTRTMEPIVPSSAMRYSIVTPSTCPNSCLFQIGVQNSSATLSHYLSISVTETTLYAPGWSVSTAAGGNTYFQILNSTSVALSYTLTLTGSTSLNGLTTASFNTGTAPIHVTTTTGGWAILTHNGPPGAFQVDAQNAAFGGGTNQWDSNVPFGPVRGK